MIYNLGTNYTKDSITELLKDGRFTSCYNGEFYTVNAQNSDILIINNVRKTFADWKKEYLTPKNH